MKYLWFLLIPSLAFGEGKFTLKMPAFSSIDNHQPEAGLFIYENIGSKGFYYQSWSGGRLNNWFSSNHDLMYRVNDKVSIGAGPSYYGWKDWRKNQTDEVRVSGTLEVKLWD